MAAELSLVAEGVVRLRVAPGLQLRPAQSWSVGHFSAKATAPEIVLSKGVARFNAKGVEVRCDLRTGEFSFLDSSGMEIVRLPGGAIRFEDGKPQLSLALGEREQIFGLGQTSGPLNKRGQTRELWNTDVLGHSRSIHPGLRSLYISIPFVISLRDGRAAGLFWDNAAKQTWEIGVPEGDRCRVNAELGEIDLYVFIGPWLPDILRGYSELTGRMPLPPRWALGYHQSRYSYGSRREVLALAREFRRRQIPCDVIHLDIHYMNDYRVFTFGKRFSKARAMLRELHKIGFRSMAIIDPGIKVDPQYTIYSEARKLRALVLDPSGKKPITGKVWPGESVFPDFTSEKVRRWWAEQQSAFQTEFEIDGFWNDMNEPAAFDGPGKTLDGRAIHRTDFGPKTHAEVHNIYASQMARASRAGALAARPRERPFLLSRDGFAGIQKQAAVWTGDNSSFWEHLGESIPMLLNLGLSGVPFCGADAGGFMEHCTGELLARWTQLAAFTPLFRNHCNDTARAQEPWVFGQETEDICRRYIQLRYQLLPYLYSLFEEAARTGTPLMRPMFWEFQNDADAARVGDQFMLGSALLVAPILQQGGRARSVYLPRGTWFNFWTGEEVKGGQFSLIIASLSTLPLFVRSGSIIPFQELQQHTGEKKIETITLHVWPGAQGRFNWYEDDGISNDFERGISLRRLIEYGEGARGGALVFGEPEGNFASPIKCWRVIVHSKARLKTARLEGQALAGQYVPELGLFIFDVPNLPDTFKVSWK